MCFIKTIFLFALLFSFYINVKSQNNLKEEYSLQIESVSGNIFQAGEKIKFKGQLIKKHVDALNIKHIGVADPISQISTKIELDSVNTFEYSTLTATKKSGTYCFVFLIPISNGIEKAFFYTISVRPDYFNEPNLFYIPLNDIKLSLGYQGNELDESTDLFSKKVLNKNYSQNNFSPSTLSFYAESFGDVAVEYGKKYLQTIVSSPTNYIVLIGASVICIGTGGIGCAPAYGILLKNLVTTSIELDIDYLVDQSNLDLASKNKVKFWTKLGTKGVISVSGLSNSPEGANGFLSGVNLGGKWTEFLINNEPPLVKNIRYNPNGEVTDYSIEVSLKNGSLIYLTASSLANEVFQIEIPNPFKYFDTEIVMLNGQIIVGNVISGQFEGIEYGISTSTPSNSIKFVFKDGTIKNIPTYDIKSIKSIRLEIVELNDGIVKLNLGNQNGIKQSQVYQVYKLTKDILNKPVEFIHGYIQILEVNDFNSIGIIVNQINGGFTTGNYCR